MTMPGDRTGGAPTMRESRRDQIFPVLNEHQLAVLAGYGERRRCPAGTVLFEEGQRHIPMFVLISGSIEIVRRTSAGEELLVTDMPGMFTGEVGQLSGRAAIASGRAREDCEVVVVDEAALRRIVVAEADLSELIMRAFILRRVALIEDGVGGATVVGSRHSGETLRLRHFLTRNAQPHIYLDVDGEAGTGVMLQRFGVGGEDLPVVIGGDGRVLRKPTLRQVADSLGLGPERLDGRRFDVAVVGAGPAGLAAAVYAASEGLQVIVLDGKAPGGQAATTSRIENYFGFPTGISGQALAGRGFVQAEKFGAEVAIPRESLRLECAGNGAVAIHIDGGERITARAVVIATGARYRKPALANLERFEGRGVYYAASFMEAQLCSQQEVIVVGGGNSAGQAAVFLAPYAKHVHILVRGGGLAASMSSYLVRRIEGAANITLHTESEIVALEGEQDLERVRWLHRPSQAVHDCAVRSVFLFLGAAPNTAWIDGCLALDAAGFVKTGAAIMPVELEASRWPLARPPYPLETNRPGIFAVGDVRSGSVKRVAAAVGEGSSAVQTVHAVLAEGPISSVGQPGEGRREA